MSLAYFIEQNTCKAHFSMISAGNYPPTEGECLVCENQRLRARLEPFLAQEREQNAANRVAVESVANKKAAAEAEDAMNDHHAGSGGSEPIRVVEDSGEPDL